MGLQHYSTSAQRLSSYHCKDNLHLNLDLDNQGYPGEQLWERGACGGLLNLRAHLVHHSKAKTFPLP